MPTCTCGFNPRTKKCWPMAGDIVGDRTIYPWIFLPAIKINLADGHQLYHGICLSRRRQPTAIPCSHHRFAKRSPDSAFTWLKPKPVIRPQMKPWCIPKKRNFQSLPNQSKERKMLTLLVKEQKLTPAEMRRSCMLPQWRRKIVGD